MVRRGLGGLSVSPGCSLVCVSGRLFRGGCLRARLCVSVAVFVACQDVEVAVGCGVVRRPALQHHHPAGSTNTHTARGNTQNKTILVSMEGEQTT